MLNSTGTAQLNVSPDEIGNVWIPIPNMREQRAIAEFLDRETANIDESVARKERLIELLEEKRAALITHAVTYGLNPEAPLRESGIEWLGQIPAHWEVRRNKSLFVERDERSAEGAEELLTVSHLTGVTPRSEKNVNMIMAESHEGYKLCRSGDLVINTMWAWMGALGVARQNGMVSPSYNVYRISRDCVLPNYLDYVCRTPSFVCGVTTYSKGIWSSRLRLYPGAFMQLVTAVPPIEEQQVIVSHLDAHRRKLEPLIAAIEDGLERLKEYRSGLITAAVTGKIDVPREAKATA